MTESPATQLHEIIADLLDEQAALDKMVANLVHEQWYTDTPSPGWTIADQISHLTYFDGAAVAAIVDADEFRKSAEQLLASGADTEVSKPQRDPPPPLLLTAWRTNRQRLAEAAATLPEHVRLPWYGPSMGTKSFITARLMEYWAHGQDIADALKTSRLATDRLRHIARLGFVTRAWSYVNRRLEVPTVPVRVELTSPSGAAWCFGPASAADVIRGPGLDFCLVVTQRRHVDDTDLSVIGGSARDWMEKAQAFAGPPTAGPPPAQCRLAKVDHAPPRKVAQCNRGRAVVTDAAPGFPRLPQHPVERGD
jgi:uncharacterized protein (TIGR03084 family)